jgi:quinol-cytochrome oxidoreductase complex cytochrome b subunit
MEKTVTLPDWAYQLVRFLDRNWQAILGVVLIAILASATVEVVKRRYTLKQDEKMAKRAVAWLLTTISAGFTTLGYLIFLAQSNETLVKQIPYIGQGVIEVLGTAYLLYNLRLNKTWQNVANVLGKWSKSEQPVVETKTVSPQPLAAPSDDQFA